MMTSLSYDCCRYDNLLDAIRTVETCSCVCEQSHNALGDGGKSLGPYQIGKAYWTDACQKDKSLTEWSYETVKQDWYARKVIIAYWNRYAPDAADNETLARIHNGGGGIMRKRGTKAWNNTTVYWEKVERKLNVNS